MDNAIRRCGMLAAEVVAKGAGKKLDFGDWEGDDGDKPWAQKLRRLLEGRDVDVALVDEPPPKISLEEPLTANVQERPPPPPPTKKPRLVSVVDVSRNDDSDDSLTGYASPTSSRSASPTPSELDEIEKDPTLNIGVKKVSRPVYLAQLGEMVRSTGGTKESNQEADKIDKALNYGEELIRKRRHYGTELGSYQVFRLFVFPLTRIASGQTRMLSTWLMDSLACRTTMICRILKPNDNWPSMLSLLAVQKKSLRKCGASMRGTTAMLMHYLQVFD